MVSRAAAVSRAEKSRTSRKISAARWRRRQVLEGGDEGELDRLALLVAGLGPRRFVLDEELGVGDRFDPDRLGERLVVRLVRV